MHIITFQPSIYTLAVELSACRYTVYWNMISLELVSVYVYSSYCYVKE